MAEPGEEQKELLRCWLQVFAKEEIPSAFGHPEGAVVQIYLEKNWKTMLK